MWWKYNLAFPSHHPAVLVFKQTLCCWCTSVWWHKLVVVIGFFFNLILFNPVHFLCFWLLRVWCQWTAIFPGYQSRGNRLHLQCCTCERLWRTFCEFCVPFWMHLFSPKMSSAWDFVCVCVHIHSNCTVSSHLAFRHHFMIRFIWCQQNLQMDAPTWVTEKLFKVKSSW